MQSLSPKRKKVRTRGGAISARRRQSEAHRNQPQAREAQRKQARYAPAEVLSPPAGGSPKRTETNRKQEASAQQAREAQRKQEKRKESNI